MIILKTEITKIPTLPLRDIVVFPETVFPLFVGRKQSVKSLQKAFVGNKELFLITQKNPDIDKVSRKDLYDVGVKARIIQMLKLPDGTIKVLVDTISRAKLIDFKAGDIFLSEIEDVVEESIDSIESKSIIANIKNKYKIYTKLENRLPTDLVSLVFEIKNPSKLADHIIASLPLSLKVKQEILEESNILKRLQNSLILLNKEYDILSAEKKIKKEVNKQVSDNQKQYYLNEQLKAIKKELGGEESETLDDEVKNFEKQIKEKKLSEEAKEKANSELKKLKSMNPMSADASIIRTYLECLLELPWNILDEINIDLEKSEAVLDRDHYGLEKVKERILEYIAVNRRVKKVRGPILCLVGPPGVGKTSLAKSIAESMGRKFAKISLGGMRDEAEIRGHRRTYLGALPGRFIQTLKKKKSSNPLILLDELDKIGKDFRGDPASALLEVLDPEQNKNFNDHYLEVDYDLSDIMFVATANSLDIPYALRDRLEVINLSGYTEDEKLYIINQHLLAKILKEHGLKEEEFSISDAAIIKLIREYTFEAGVRNIEREIANLVRKSIRKIDSDKKLKKVSITVSNLAKYAGTTKCDYGRVEDKDLIGITTGLAYTQSGGDILSIEAVKTPGTGKITCTGKLGEVMKESVQAAFNYVKSKCTEFDIDEKLFKKYDIHIHVPEGATPKDGPSAGIAICNSIISVLTGRKIDRLIAMTGEITLRGRVLPIGGLKEKLLAALRAGIAKAVIPAKNAKDLKEIPSKVQENIEITLAENMFDVIKVSLK